MSESETNGSTGSPGRRGGMPPLPESLLGPLLDTAADALRSLEPQAVPVSLRRLAGFDRKGLTRGAARQQLLKAIQSDEAFHDEAVDRFCEQPEVAAALDTWDPASTLEVVEEAAKRADLPLLASALYAARPRGWAFGLGAICAAFDRHRVEQEEGDELRARDMQIAALEESRRRADAGRIDAEQAASRLERELREERKGRRAREDQAAKEVAEARKVADEAERLLAKARADTEAAGARLEREAERARAAEQERRELRRELSEAQRKAAAVPRAPVLRPGDLQALVDAGDLARRLADGLGGVADKARQLLPEQANTSSPAKTEKGGSAPTKGDGKPGRVTRRPLAPIPRGMAADDPKAVDAMLRTQHVVLVVDGYNVSMLAWGDASPSEQRERLLAALAGLQMRTRAGIIVVFDGADVEDVRTPRRPGLKVMFSPADEEADAVVVREASALPSHVPVIVASSDGWVANKARQVGARVVTSVTLLELLR
jgi:predicted RNA-binding protein with PIN domain